MINKRVRVFTPFTNSEVEGVVISKGCFYNSYIVDLGSLYINIVGKLENQFLFFEDELTIVSH